MSKIKTTCNSPEVDKEWQAECDLRTLISAAEVMTDRSRLQAARKLAKEQKKDLEALLQGAGE